FTSLDASLIEINPLVVTGDGSVLALDAKMNFDDNALFRHKEVLELRDEDDVLAAHCRMNRVSTIRHVVAERTRLWMN
ncbi:MAG: hypothetical protein QF735_07765, partial [Phycisphaeraceae bacterium]|nr:hypothetical protein [Phycisphaeraceae bacterium]